MNDNVLLKERNTLTINFSRRRKILKWSILIPLPFFLNNILTAVAKENDEMIPDDLEQRGKALRKEIIRIYHELNKSQKLNAAGVYIDDSLKSYISIGMPFKSVEVVLRCAGYEIDPLPPRPSPQNPPPWYKDDDRFLLLGYTVLENGDAYQVTSSIAITPDDNISLHFTVKNVTGFIRLTGL
jgi:hypothetical protein